METLNRIQAWKDVQDLSNSQRSIDWALYNESGGTFNRDFPGVKEGYYHTKQLSKMVGISNDPADSGGWTKYGMAYNAHKSEFASFDEFKKITLADAEQMYVDGYWNSTSCQFMAYEPAFYVFDAACGSGPQMAKKMLQYALGVAVDGQIGPMTLQALQMADPYEVVRRMNHYRLQFYAGIAVRRPDNAKFLPGWNRRANVITFDEFYAQQRGGPMKKVDWDDGLTMDSLTEDLISMEIEGKAVLLSECLEYEAECANEQS